MSGEPTQGEGVERCPDPRCIEGVLHGEYSSQVCPWPGHTTEQPAGDAGRLYWTSRQWERERDRLRSRITSLEARAARAEAEANRLAEECAVKANAATSLEAERERLRELLSIANSVLFHGRSMSPNERDRIRHALLRSPDPTTSEEPE